MAKQKQTDREVHESDLIKKVGEIHQPKVEAAKQKPPKGGAE